MTSSPTWLILWWAGYHACWLRSIKATVEASPEELVDAVVSSAIRRMRSVKRRWNR